MISIPESILFCSSFGGDGESMVFFKSRPLLLNSALSATNWRSGEPSRQSLAKCIFSDSLSPMLLKNTRNSPVQFQTKCARKVRALYIFTISITYKNRKYCDESMTYVLPRHILFRLGCDRKLLIIFSEALGKVSPKIRRLRRLWREGFPERQLVEVSG